MSWLLAVLAIGATYRITRLITADYIAAPVREWIVRRFGEGKLAYLSSCDWCLSFWFGWPPAVLAVWWPTNRVVWLILLALTASTLVGLIAQHLEAEE